MWSNLRFLTCIALALASCRTTPGTASDTAPAPEPIAAPASGPDLAAPPATAPTLEPQADEPQAAPEPAPPDPPTRVRLVAVGDVLFGRYTRAKRYRPVVRNGDAFEEVGELFRGADLAFINLECPITAEPRTFTTNKTYTFRAELDDVHVLTGAGIDLVSIANNHSRDFGFDAVVSGRRHLEQAGLVVAGAGAGIEQAHRPAIIEQSGVRVALLAYTVWLWGTKKNRANSAVAYVRNEDLRQTVLDAVTRTREAGIADILLVSLHWGWEYEPHPRDWQRDAARAFIDAGAHVILGHHPHIIQDIERYRDGLIAYSLGNFVFDSSSIGQRRTLMLDVVIEHSARGVRTTDVVVHPIINERRTHIPRFARARAYRAWRRELVKLAPDVVIADEPAAR